MHKLPNSALLAISHVHTVCLFENKLISSGKGHLRNIHLTKYCTHAYSTVLPRDHQHLRKLCMVDLLIDRGFGT